MIYLSCVLMVAVGCAAVAFSDHFIRRAGRAGTFGLNPESWDITGLLIVLVGLAGFVALMVKAVF